MSKLRMIKRRKVLTFTPAYDLHAKILLGYLGDLTLKGALLVSETPVEVGQTLTLAIEFRTSAEAMPIPMTLSSHVAWCKQDEHHTHYNVGLEFLAITDQNKKLIESVLETSQFSSKIPG